MLVLLFVTGSFLISGCGEKTQDYENVVAEVGENNTITLKDLKIHVINYFYDRRYRDKATAYNKALEAMVTNQLERIDFFERDLQNDRKLTESISRNISEELIVRYFNTQVLAKYTSEERIRQAYEQMGKEVEYRQIMLDKPENASKAQLDIIRNRADEIKSRIENGEDFGQLVRQYSQDAESAAEDGFMPPITWEKSISNPLYQMIFQFDSGDVRVLESLRSFMIIKITGIHKIDREPLETLKAGIKSDLEKMYMDISLNDYDEMKKKLIDENSLQWNQKALDQIIRWSRTPRFYEGLYRDTLQQAITDGRNPTILTYSEGAVDLKEYLWLLDHILIPGGSGNITKQSLKDFILEALRTDIIVQKAKQLGLEQDVLNPNTASSVIRNKLVQLYNQAVIESQIPEATETALQQFYHVNRDSMYYQLAKVNIYALIYPDRETAEKMWSKIKEGATIPDVSDRYFVKTFIRTREGEIRAFSSTEVPYLGEAAFALKESETNGVIEYNDPEKGKQFAVIQCVHRRPEKQLTYADVKNTIPDDFREFHLKRLHRQVAEDLRKKYRVVIHRDVLKKGIAEASR